MLSLTQNRLIRHYQDSCLQICGSAQEAQTLLDRLFGSFLILGLLLARHIEFVTPMLGSMNPKNLQTVRRLGKGDRLVKLTRLSACNTSSDPQLLAQLPEEIILREITYPVHVRGFRPKTLVLLTSLLDSTRYPLKEIGELYYLRWQCELDLRSIKQVLQMEQLTCKTPEMVRKEIWAHLLAYNLVRVVMTQSALHYEIKPRQLSFKGTLQLFNAFRTALSHSKQAIVATLYRDLLLAISQQKLVYRPGRIEPRAIKKKQSPYSVLRIPRAEARKRYWKKGSAFNKRKNERSHPQGAEGMDFSI